VIVGYLGERHPELAATPPPGPPDTSSHQDPRIEEHALVFGTSHRLFGVLAQPPPERVCPDRPAVILTNAGTVHRIGPHRQYVELARALAELGFYVFRIDLAGIGDSAVSSSPENLCYPDTGLADCQEAMTFLAAKLGVQRFVVAGLCSGGDIAFQLGITDPRIAGVVMMNPRTFCVHDLAQVESYKDARHYQTSLFKKEKWLKLLRGEVDLARAAKRVVPKLKAVAARSVTRLVDRVRSRSAGEVVHADVPDHLRAMAERGVDTFLLVAERDPGVDYVDVEFGKKMQALTSVANYRREDLSGTDHTFTSVWSQLEIRTLIREHLARRYPRC
jgi:pimeloyl-ACP methyl ester carboxylesterase